MKRIKIIENGQAISVKYSISYTTFADYDCNAQRKQVD